jgi:hypothetical protein
MLSLHAQSLAARYQYLHQGTVSYQLRDINGRRQHLLKIVQDEEEVLLREVGFERFEQGLARDFLRIERLSYGGDNQLWVGNGRKGHEKDPIPELAEQSLGDLEGETGLACAAGTCEGEQATPAQQAFYLGDLSVSSNETGELPGQALPSACRNGLSSRSRDHRYTPPPDK